MIDPQAAKTGYILETQQVFSKSLLWDLQRQYFAQMGVEAWRQGEVPHYVTSNPTIANSYAEVVFAFWRDQQRLVSLALEIIDKLTASRRFARTLQSGHQYYGGIAVGAELNARIDRPQPDQPPCAGA